MTLELPPLPLDAIGFAARLAFVVIFRWVYMATLTQRAKWTPDPCSRCGNLVYPFCQDNRPRVVSLVADLRQQAGAEDAAFVAFAAALAGDDTLGASVDVTTVRALVGKRSTPCHWGSNSLNERKRQAFACDVFISGNVACPSISHTTPSVGIGYTTR